MTTMRRQENVAQSTTNTVSSSLSSAPRAESRKRKAAEIEEQKTATQYANIMKRLVEMDAKMNVIMGTLHHHQTALLNLNTSLEQLRSLQNTLNQNTMSTYTTFAKYMLHVQQSITSSQAQPSSTPPLNSHQVNPVPTTSNAGNPLFYPMLSFYPQQPSQPTVTNNNTAATSETVIPHSLLPFFLQANASQPVMGPQTILNTYRHVSIDSVLPANAHTQYNNR